MGEPVKKSSTEKVPLKCGEGEYLYTSKHGRKVCLPEEPPMGELMGSGMTCGEGGGFPCDVGGTGLIFPEESHGPSSAPPPKDQFTPGSSTENQTLTRIAEYQCTQTHYTKIFRPYGVEGESEIPSGSEQLSRKTPITIKIVPNESPAETEDRFEKAAEIELRGMLFRKEMSECSGHQFVRFSSTAQGALKAGSITLIERR